jgi:hypothetical protein
MTAWRSRRADKASRRVQRPGPHGPAGAGVPVRMLSSQVLLLAAPNERGQQAGGGGRQSLAAVCRAGVTSSDSWPETTGSLLVSGRYSTLVGQFAQR